MIRQRLDGLLERRRCTLLGVGPMSLNCVDAAIELANDNSVPIQMIASRRQVDSEEFGGGYVNNWTTSQFADYVGAKDKKGMILLARDHGGPWQNTVEIDQSLGLRRAMESAKVSFRADLEAGFQVLHLDPSIDIHDSPDADEVLERLFELMEFCWSEARTLRRDVVFEIGTEEQSGSTNSPEELIYTLESVHEFCVKNRIPDPCFVVIQAGTRVMETRNVGSFDSPVRVANELPAEIQVPRMIEICERFGVFMKGHNTDYLSDEALKWHPRLGIHAANVAPEFGVAETRGLVDILRSNGLDRYADRFLQLSLDSCKWAKWMLPATNASDVDRAIIAGHYVFATDEGRSILDEVARDLEGKGVDLNQHLKDIVKGSILRYLKHFRMMRDI
jgi:tagatose-6-phosphate kinase